VSDVVLGVILHGFALVCVILIMIGGFAESSRAERDFAKRTPSAVP
jgi:hypothetical protein